MFIHIPSNWHMGASNVIEYSHYSLACNIWRGNTIKRTVYEMTRLHVVQFSSLLGLYYIYSTKPLSSEVLTFRLVPGVKWFKAVYQRDVIVGGPVGCHITNECLNTKARNVRDLVWNRPSNHLITPKFAHLVTAMLSTQLQRLYYDFMMEIYRNHISGK